MNIILKSIFLVHLFSSSCNLATNKEKKVSRSLSKTIYTACQKNDYKAIEEICNNHGFDILNKVFTCSYVLYPEVPIGGYPIEVLSTHKHWKSLHTLIEKGIDINIKHHYYQNFLAHVASTEDLSKEKLLVMNTLLKKNLDINALNYNVSPASSVFYHYVEANNQNIKYNDPIIAWFIENGVTIQGTKFYVHTGYTYANNIFHNILEASRPCTSQAINIAKSVCYNLLLPAKKNIYTFLMSLKLLFKTKKDLCFKIPKPLMQNIVSIMLLKNSNTKKIIAALEQKIDSQEKTPFDYINSKNSSYIPYQVQKEDKIIIYSAQEWKSNTLNQFILCNSSN